MRFSKMLRCGCNLGPALASNEEIRDWLHWVMKVTQLKPTPLAKEAGLAPSTLLRALDPQNDGGLENRSINKIVKRFKVPGPPAPHNWRDAREAGPMIQSGFHEPELVRYTADIVWPGLIVELKPTEGRWQLKTRALELAGYLPGDLLDADSATQPRQRDVVVAQIVHASHPGAETVLRIYDAPYLLTETLDETARRKPVLVDNISVSIWGTVVRTHRERQP